jgi:hypothetical protein
MFLVISNILASVLVSKVNIWEFYHNVTIMLLWHSSFFFLIFSPCHNRIGIVTFFSFSIFKPLHDVTCHQYCYNPSFGLAIKAKGCKVAGQEGDLGVTSHAPRSVKSVREWTFTLPSELPLWELESQMDSQTFTARLQGSKPIDLKCFLYHWKVIKM